ncbi:MAG: T9SS type A sorting domain-containing protein [Bacteroidales bacterium]|nr:T9SS type A sorting domain-containing protein [Bacteroidales bacterium]
MYTRILTIIGVLFIINSAIIQAQWISEKSPTDSDLNAIFLVNDNSGWIVGDNGTMIYKVNKHWVEYKSITDQDLYSVYMLDIDEGWAVGAKGIILHFDGKNWKAVESPTTRDLFSVSFSDPEHGIAVGRRGTILHYENKTWRNVRRNFRGNFYATSFTNDFTFIGGGQESGNLPIIEWSEKNSESLNGSFVPYNLIRSISQTENNQAWAVGPCAIFHFNGEYWERTGARETTPSLIHVYFSEEDYGICVGCEGEVLLYAAGEWIQQDVPLANHLRGSYISDDTYYAVGDNGTILSLSRGTEINETVSSTQKVLALETYPNPCNNYLNIIAPDSDGFSTSKITITNLFGQVILNKKVDFGLKGHVHTIDTGNLIKGVYLINVQSEDGQYASGKFTVSR